MTFIRCRNVFGSPCCYDQSAALPAFRSDIYDMVSSFDDVQIVFNDNDRIPLVH